jgi:iduronate 2-sulfatase
MRLRDPVLARPVSAAFLNPGKIRPASASPRMLRFTHTPAANWIWGTLVGVGFASVTRGAERLNVLFICIDDLRPELGCYGAPLVKTPHIDQLARNGTVFRRAYCQQALCAPSRACVLTGLRPDTSGITDLSHPVRKTVPTARTLPQHFRENGYETHALGKIYHHGSDDNGLGWSAPTWAPPKMWEQAVDRASAPLSAGGRSTAWEAPDVPDDAYPDGKIAQKAVAELAQFAETKTPFFLAVGFLKPHLPFFAPKRYWDLYDEQQIRLPEPSDWPEHMPQIAGMNSEELRQYRDIPKSGPMDPALARRLIHGYYACVSYVDALVGEVLAELDRRDLRKNTIIVLWGDHGWKLGDYGAWCKHTNFEVDARAPLIVVAPQQRTRGAACDRLVELIDLYPTLAAAAGLAVPEHCEGTSLLPLLDDPALAWTPAAFSQYPRGQHIMGYSVRDERWRFTEWTDRRDGKVIARELYDHGESPTASQNLAGQPQYADTEARLSALLDHGQGWRAFHPSPRAATK